MVQKTVCAPQPRVRERRMKQRTPWLRDVHSCWPLKLGALWGRSSRREEEALVRQRNRTQVREQWPQVSPLGLQAAQAQAKKTSGQLVPVLAFHLLKSRVETNTKCH